MMFKDNYVKSNDGKYRDLEFAYLKEFSIIDMHLRYLLIQMTLEIRHFTKLFLVNLLISRQENMYEIIQDYIGQLSEESKSKFYNELKRNNHYFSIVENNILDFYVFIEMVSFGRVLDFYKFCSLRYKDKGMLEKYYMLRACKELRNNVAHNKCILNDLHNSNQKYNANYQINRELSNINNISKVIRNKKMSNIRVAEIVTLFYVYREHVINKEM